ncbi:MAG: DUF1571 domain-containing protein, partial [Pirellulaceae bacterium]|nr:DUF1571 domain-containing protein [Pirellulaceae bacterium]
MWYHPHNGSHFIETVFEARVMANVIKMLAPYACMLFGSVIVVPAIGFGEEPTLTRKPLLAASFPRKLAFDPLYTTRNSLPANWESHPLAPALNLARERGAYLHEHVRDFTCLLVKRERINGQLRDYEYLATKVRREQRRGDKITTPFSIYSQFLGPAKVRGRKVLYVQGENEGKMLVRNGGSRFNYITVKLEPDSAAALRESRYPITELGLDSITQRLINQTLSDIRHDPTGENSRVTFFRQASVEDRPCLHIQVVHPTRHEQFTYHIANIYIDSELHMPIRVETHGWPKDGDTKPVLEEEYTLTRLRLN